jgi:hypothetical protein
MKKIIVASVIVIVLLVNNYFWLMNYLDICLEMESENFHYGQIEKALNDLKKITLEITPNMGKDHLVDIINKNIERPEIFEKDGNVYYNNLGFIFKDNKIIQVTEQVPFNEDSLG